MRKVGNSPNNITMVDERKRTGDPLYAGGPVRVVTEADLLADPRLVAASAVVGQLYDFSNLPYIKDGLAERNVEELNRNHEVAEEKRVARLERVKARPEFTSEVERAQMAAESKPVEPIGPRKPEEPSPKSRKKTK